jgi:GNAT superfamily N-acetyltransferase
VIRDANLDDLVALKDVYRRASLSNEGDRANLLAHPEALEYSDEWVRRRCTRVVIRDDRIVGFATAFDRDGELEVEDLFVDPDWMRRGFGLALIDDIASRARRDGVARIMVTANPHALAFYEAAGFVVDGPATVPWGSAFRMHRDP